MTPRATLINGLLKLAVGVYDLGINRDVLLGDAAEQMELDAKEIERLKRIEAAARVIVSESGWHKTQHYWAVKTGDHSSLMDALSPPTERIER